MTSVEPVYGTPATPPSNTKVPYSPVHKSSAPKSSVPESPVPRSPVTRPPESSHPPRTTPVASDGGTPVIIISTPDPVFAGRAQGGQPYRMGPLGNRPTVIVCPYCNTRVITHISIQPSWITWLLCGGIFLASLWCCLCFIPCWLIPFCVPELQDIQHVCPNCGNFVGRNW